MPPSFCRPASELILRSRNAIAEICISEGSTPAEFAMPFATASASAGSAAAPDSDSMRSRISVAAGSVSRVSSNRFDGGNNEPVRRSSAPSA